MTVKFAVSSPVAIPATMPVVPSSVNPAGKLPAEIDHVIGVVPVAVIPCTYGHPMRASGNTEGAVIVGPVGVANTSRV